MRKLARTDEPADTNGTNGTADKRNVPKPRTEVKPLPVTVSQASRCVVLKNCFDPSQYVRALEFPEQYTNSRLREEGEAWIKDLEEDVRNECEEKFGHVVHIALDPTSQGDIYLKFDRVQGGENAIKGLNGRFFGGRIITAQPVVDKIYSSLFSRASTREM